MTTMNWPLFPQSDMKATLLSDKARLYNVQDGDNTVFVIIYKEDGMDFGEHCILRTCHCESDECHHVNAALSQVMTCTLTFNDRHSDDEETV